MFRSPSVELEAMISDHEGGHNIKTADSAVGIIPVLAPPTFWTKWKKLVVVVVVVVVR